MQILVFWELIIILTDLINFIKYHLWVYSLSFVFQIWPQKSSKVQHLQMFNLVLEKKQNILLKASSITGIYKV